MKYVMSKNESSFVVANSLDELICNYNFIGFVGNDGARYIVITGGSARGLAVMPNGTWSNKEKQEKYQMSQYRVFDTADELYDWMKGKDISDEDF